jgi:large subunit ribosomal protein L13
MIIDAKNLIIGRLASFAAKQALLGETIEIINIEQTIITGSKQNVVAKQHQRLSRGHTYKGPFTERNEENFFKRLVRGMLPYKQAHGKIAWKKIKCHIGVPDHLKDKKAETVANANMARTNTLKYIRLSELCRLMGGR